MNLLYQLRLTLLATQITSLLFSALCVFFHRALGVKHFVIAVERQ